MALLAAMKKVVAPTAAQPASPVAGLDAATFLQRINPNPTTHRGNVALNALGEFAGFSGDPLDAASREALNQIQRDTAAGVYYANESGVNYAPDLSGTFKYNQALLDALKGYTFTPSGDAERAGYNVISPTGQSRLINWRTADSSFDKFADKAVPIALSAIAGNLAGGLLAPAAPVGGAGGALNLVDSVYGLGGALGPGVEAGTIGGLSGSTAAFGGLGSVLPEAVSYAGSGALTSALPEAFNAAKDSQLASEQLGITGAESAANATAPAAVDLGSLGGVTPTAAPMPLDTLRAGELSGYATNGTMPAPAVPTNGGGLLGSLPSGVTDVAKWMKDNPTLGRLVMGGVTSLLSGVGGGSQPAQTRNIGPAIKWSSPLQQGLLSPVQQYAPPVQTRPAGLLAQGQQNDGAWRYLKG